MSDESIRASAIQLSSDKPEDVLIQEFIVQTAVASLVQFDRLNQAALFREMDSKSQIAIFASGTLIAVINRIRDDILSSVPFTRDDPGALDKITRMVVEKFIDAAIHNCKSLGTIRTDEQIN